MELQVGYLKLKMQGCSPLEQQQRSALRGNCLPLGSGELLIVFIVCLCIKCCASLHPFYLQVLFSSTTCTASSRDSGNGPHPLATPGQLWKVLCRIKRIFCTFIVVSPWDIL